MRVAVVGATAPVPGWEDRTVWLDPWPRVGAGGWAYTADPDPATHPGADWSWREYLVTRADLEATVRALGTGVLAGWSLAGTTAAEALRIEAGRCYVQGLLCETEAPAQVSAQPDWPANASPVLSAGAMLAPLPPAGSGAAGRIVVYDAAGAAQDPPDGTYLAYLEEA